MEISKSVYICGGEKDEPLHGKICHAGHQVSDTIVVDLSKEPPRPHIGGVGGTVDDGADPASGRVQTSLDGSSEACLVGDGGPQDQEIAIPFGPLEIGVLVSVNEGRDPIAAAQKLFHAGTADEAGGAGDQNKIVIPSGR